MGPFLLCRIDGEKSGEEDSFSISGFLSRSRVYITRWSGLITYVNIKIKIKMNFKFIYLLFINSLILALKFCPNFSKETNPFPPPSVAIKYTA